MNMNKLEILKLRLPTATDQSGIKFLGQCGRLAVLMFAALSVCLAPEANALSGAEILEKHSNRPTPQTFRIGVQVKNVKKEKLNSKHVLWIIGKRTPEMTYMFIDFEEPEDAKGLRFLFLLDKGGDSSTKAFGYLPATDTTAPLHIGKRSVNIAGTGLTIDDLRGFVLSKTLNSKLLREEKVGKFDCYVIGLDMEADRPRKMAWISKDEFLLIKSQDLDSESKVDREFLVKEFFTTDSGEKWARREEVILPKEATRIHVEQIAGVYNIEIPPAALDPAKFGTFDWRNPND